MLYAEQYVLDIKVMKEKVYKIVEGFFFVTSGESLSKDVDLPPIFSFSYINFLNFCC